MYQTERFDLKLFLAALGAGLLAWIIDAILYGALADRMWRPLLIGLMFLIFALLVGGAILITSKLVDGFDEEFLFLSGTGMIAAGLAVTLVVTVLLAVVFEAIYEYEATTTTSASSYIFVLDESGSMADSDPDLLRYSAVDEVLSDMSADFPYAVYAFSNDTQRVRDMSPVSSGSDYALPSMGGMTNMRLALETVLNDLKQGNLEGGAAPKVVLLTDGYASDIGLFNSVNDLLDDYVDAGVSVSTVGLGQVDEGLMENIAQRTGGVFVPVDEAGELAGAMQTAALRSTSRDLLSSRVTPGRNLLYGFLRVIFLFLLGCVLAFLKAMACARLDEHIRILVVGGIAALVGALVMELGTAIGLPAGLCWLVLWLLLSLTPAMLTIQTQRGGTATIYSSMGTGGGIRFN